MEYETDKQVINYDIPTTLKSRIFIDLDNVYYDKALKSNSLFQSWLISLKKIDTTKAIMSVDLDEVLLMREEKTSIENQIKKNQLDDLKVRTETLKIIEDASKYRASDIHFHIKPDITEVMFRIDNELKIYKQLTFETGSQIARTIVQGLAKIRESYMHSEFQNAQLSGEHIRGFGLTSARVIRGPSYPQEDEGGFTVMRLQYDARKNDKKNMPYLEYPKKPEGNLNLEKEGFTKLQIDLLNHMMEINEGIIFVSGPTGSGKTTTLAKLLTQIARESPEKRLITIEDPVENPMPWAIQLEVKGATDGKETGYGFAKCMRASLRSDPDIILLGEIRDKEVANIAKEAAISGHQVWTTIHTNDPFNIIFRLENMDHVDLNRTVICDHTLIIGLTAQRLVPRLCQDCARPLNDVEEMINNSMFDYLKTWPDFSLKDVKIRTIGNKDIDKNICTKCKGSGILGRIPVSEIVLTNQELMFWFVEYGTEHARKNHRMKEGSDKSILGNAIDLISKGICDPTDVRKSLRRFPKYEAGL